MCLDSNRPGTGGRHIIRRLWSCKWTIIAKSYLFPFVLLAYFYLLTNPPPNFRRGTPAAPKEPRWPINHFSLIALLAEDDLGGRILLSTCATRILLLPRLMSLGAFLSISNSFVFLLKICLPTGGEASGGRIRSSSVSRSSGRRAGRAACVDLFEAV